MGNIPHNTLNINRRFAIGAIGAIATSPIVATASHATSNDPHRAWFKRWQEIDSDEMSTDPQSEQNRLGKAICSTVATTPEGLLAQLEWFQADFGDHFAEEFFDPYASFIKTTISGVQKLI